MSLHKRIFAVLLLVCLAGAAFALDIEWKGKDSTYDAEIQDIIDEMDDVIGDINDNPEKLIKGFADSSVFASTAATQRAYGEYRLWALTFGPMVGARLPKNYRDIIKDADKLTDTINDDGDLSVGVNVQAAFQFGLNTSRFLLDGLYLGLRFGYLNVSPTTEMDIKILHVGPVAQYQFIKGVDKGGIFKWRGITAGAGLLYQKTTLELGLGLGNSFETGVGPTRIYTSDPNLEFAMDIRTFTIPLEVNTSIQVLWVLNLSAGLGADIAFGKNKTTLNMDADVYEEYTKKNVGRITVSGGGEQSPTFFNPKVMANLGLKLGPVVIDVPVTYYFVGGPGLNVGVTVGAVW